MMMQIVLEDIRPRPFSFSRNSESAPYDHIIGEAIFPIPEPLDFPVYNLEEHLQSYRVLTDKISFTWNSAFHFNQNVGFTNCFKERTDGSSRWTHRQKTFIRNGKAFATIRIGGNWCAVDVYLTALQPDKPLLAQVQCIVRALWTRYGMTPIYKLGQLNGKDVPGTFEAFPPPGTPSENWERFWASGKLSRVEINLLFHCPLDRVLHLKDLVRKDGELACYTPDAGRSGTKSSITVYPLNVKEGLKGPTVWKLEFRMYADRISWLSADLLNGTLEEFVQIPRVQGWLRDKVQQLDRRGKRYTDNPAFERLWINRWGKVEVKLIDAIGHRLEKNPGIGVRELYRLLTKNKAAYSKGLDERKLRKKLSVFYGISGGH